MQNEGTFSVLRGEMDGHPLFAMVDTGLRGYTEKSSLPWLLSLSTPLVNPTSDGLPTRAEANNLNEWEDAVEQGLKAGGRLVFVGRVTWNGHRELLYYVAQPEACTKKLQELIDRHAWRPFAFRCERDDKWEGVSIWLNQSPMAK